MAAFYSDPKKDYSSEWSNYLQNSSYVGDITGALNYQSKEIQNNVNQLSETQSGIVLDSIKAVCGTLESGFEMLSGELQDISFELGEIRSELNSMASMLDWKLSLMIDQQRISNMLMGNITILLRIPDIQKERQDYIEKGLKFFKNARFDDDLFANSRKYLLRAIEIEPEDFFVLHRLGLIYMYSSKFLDLAKAEAYFKRAAKYAIAEANNGSEISTNYLKGDISKGLVEQKTTIDSVRLQAAESYLFLSRCCYIQKKFDESANYAEKAFSLVPQLAEAGFSQAKALAANQKESQAAIVLEQVINVDRYYSLKTLSDPDLAAKKEVQALLLKFQLETTEKAYEIVEQCKQQIINNSIAKVELFKIIRLLQKNSYLSSAKALDLLAEVRSWNLNSGIHTKLYQDIIFLLSSNTISTELKQIVERYSWDKWQKLVSSNVCNFDFLQFIKLERDYSNNASLLYTELKRQIVIIDAQRNEDHRKYEQREKINFALNYIPCFIVGALMGAFSGAVIGIVIQIIFWIGGSSGFTPFLVTVVLGAIAFGFINGHTQDYGEIFPRF